MSTKQKYYVLENGEYIVKYRDTKTNPLLKEKISSDKTFLQHADKSMTPKSARNDISAKLDSHPFANKKHFTTRRHMQVDNVESDFQCISEKQPDQRLCQITLQLTTKLKYLQQQNASLILQNKHLSSKLSLQIEKSFQSKGKISKLQQQLQSIKFSYQDHMKIYNQLCVAYEGLAQQNKMLLNTNNCFYSTNKQSSYPSSRQLQSTSQQGANTFRTHRVQEALQKTQSKIENYLFELDILKQQLAEKDNEIQQLVQQLKISETNFNNSKLTEDFLITQLQKTKAIVYNQKLLQQALNQKILRIAEDLKVKQGLLIKMCSNCRSNISRSSASLNKLFDATKMDSDEEQDTNS